MKDFDKQYRELNFEIKKIEKDIFQLKKKQHTLLVLQKQYIKCNDCEKYFKKEKQFLTENKKYICPYCGKENSY